MSDFTRDPFLIWKLNFGMPVILEPRQIILTPSNEEIWAETMDLIYDIEEHPVALERMIYEGCPNE